jgi:hypothetical protein
MTKRAWLALCAAMTIPLLTTSCGSDEATDNDTPAGGTGGSGAQPEGGDDSGGLIGGASDGTGGTTTPTGGRASGGKANAGAGGTTGGSNTAGKGGGGTGTGGTPSTPGASLGSDCVSDDNCGDLGCLVADMTGVPHGMCYADCLEDADCPANGLCVTFEDDAGETFGICFEGCTPGAPALGEIKCHERDDMSCRYLYTPTGEPCEADADCGSADKLCDTVEGQCYLAESACLPQCGSNADCPDSMFCDPDSGFCSDTEPVGDPDGTPCDPELEEDTCLGRCITFVDEMSMPVESVCVTDCSAYWPGCGWEDQTQPAPAICLPRAEGGDVGDQGFCYPLCDCDADCVGERLCYEAGESADLLEENFGHRSWCMPPDDTAESVATCP